MGRSEAVEYFFVVGAPRSGTTMLQQALNRHSRVVIPPETAFFTFLGLSTAGQRRHLSRLVTDLRVPLHLPARGVRGPDDARRFYNELARLYIERLGRGGVTHFGEKSPEHQRRLTRIQSLFPDARVVLIYRDGRDVALSLTKLPWMSRDLYVNFALWLHYYHIQRRAERTRQLRMHRVQYERLVARPVEELGKILAFLGLPDEPAVAEGCHNREGVPEWEHAWKGRALERISSSRVGVWQKELSADQVDILECWGGQALQALGYELTTGGKRRLPWTFFPKLYAKAMLWLARRPFYADAKPQSGVTPKGSS
jgi:hypothetical protein